MKFNVLSHYDDSLATCFLDKLFLWFQTTRMNKNFQDLNCNQDQIIQIIRDDLITNSFDTGLRKASSNLMKLPQFQEYCKTLSPKGVSDFKNHARQYLAMFYPTAGFEVSSTTRYTGKYEACITATRDWSAGDQVKCCKGAIAELNDEDDLKLRAEGVDFSVLFSSKKNCTCLFLGPARFMNHDCEANCSFLHSGANSVSFKVNRSISVGEEMTAYYGDHYFGENNCECLCQSCEKNQKGGFAKSKKEAAGESPDAVSSNVRRSSRSKKDVDYKNYSIAALVKKSQAKNQTKVTKRNNKRKTSMEPTESGTPLLSSSTEDNSTQASSGPSSLSPSSFEKVTKDLNVASSSPSSSLKENELYTIENDEITCCSNQQNLPVTKLPNGQRGCAKCYRHFKVFGHEWPVRKQAVPHKQKNKEAKPSTPLPVASRKRKLEHQEDEKPVRNKKQLTTMVYSAYQPYTQMPFQPIPVRPSQQILPSIRICFPEFF